MQTTLTQAARDFQPVPDLSPEDLAWWAENGPHALAPMPEAVALANDPRDFAQDWSEYEQWADAVDAEPEPEPFAGLGVRSPETLAEHAAEWARYQSRKADVSRWVG